MANVRVNAKLVRAAAGKSDIQVELLPEGASLFVVLVLDAKSARNVAELLLQAANNAELTIVMPGHDSVPPTVA